MHWLQLPNPVSRRSDELVLRAFDLSVTSKGSGEGKVGDISIAKQVRRGRIGEVEPPTLSTETSVSLALANRAAVVLPPGPALRRRFLSQRTRSPSIPFGNVLGWTLILLSTQRVSASLGAHYAAARRASAAAPSMTTRFLPPDFAA